MVRPSASTSLSLFGQFAPPVRPPSPLRRAITDAYRRDEKTCVGMLLPQARLPMARRAEIAATARQLVQALRDKPRGSGVEALVHEYALSSEEGVALMCLAEALLRIPDTDTRDALIRDKIGDGDWASHLGAGRSLFVNAATWGLVVTGKLSASVNETGLSAALTRIVARYGRPVIRRGVDLAMRMMGEQFVTGEHIEEALERAQDMEARGFRYSYDMLGEAAVTAADARRYFQSYETAVHAIGKAAAGRGIYEGPGISIKLSALHPRYSRAQAMRVMAELLPRVKKLALLAKFYDIGLNIDAEESERLELSLDILESLAFDAELAGWNGLGFVVQAYGKRCPAVLDWIIDLAQRSSRRIMVRLVKGAYWDSEIKRAQVDGLEDYPVYTRKVYTDISYIVCAQKLLAAQAHIFPQFATHNAQTLATVYHCAGTEFKPGDYEFQCLHGMGEPLYEEVVGADKLNRPCRIYAPVGTHETLLAYLVRRLLENGANSSFVNRISDPDVAIDDLVQDPVETVDAMTDAGARHDQIELPKDILGARRNSAGIDLSNESVLRALSETLVASTQKSWRASPLVATDDDFTHEARAVLNPGDHRDPVGLCVDADETLVAQAFANVSSEWAAQPVANRAMILRRAADLMQADMQDWLGLIMREAGKSAANAIAEVREAIDFLRYYADEAERTLNDQSKPLGAVVCISPWNFPLAIFTGQIAAALAAGNSVLAKPAEETPLIAANAVQLLHAAGIPRAALQFLPGDGAIGAALVASPHTAGVMFTGSTEVARLIQKQLIARMQSAGKSIPLIAETGGQNAMIVDSSALPEQVVADVIASAFDSAGQRCSALRILCLQEDIADRTLHMLKGALHELSLGRTDHLSTDIGPVITAEAKRTIETHIQHMRALGCVIEQIGAGEALSHGTFVPPTIIEIARIADVQREVFGPVLHVLRFKRAEMDALTVAINATGYGLTFGLHTRIDETIDHVTAHVHAGNIYVNRNIIGAVVGVQPFGGSGLSGTGPKAGGPLYLGRLVQSLPSHAVPAGGTADAAATAFAQWLDAAGDRALADEARGMIAASPVGARLELPGPVGETNIYSLHPKGRILLAAADRPGLMRQLAAVFATGNDAVILDDGALRQTVGSLPDAVAGRVRWCRTLDEAGVCNGAMIDGDLAAVSALASALAARPGPVLRIDTRDEQGWRLDALVEEVSLSVNTTAAGGNASLMTLDASG